MLRPKLVSELGHWLSQYRVRVGYLDALAAYRKNFSDVIFGDLAAGVVVAVMIVPQALAYAQLSGMPSVTGLFAAVLALFTYPFFGSSGHQAVGPGKKSFAGVQASAASSPTSLASLPPPFSSTHSLLALSSSLFLSLLPPPPFPHPRTPTLPTVALLAIMTQEAVSSAAAFDESRYVTLAAKLAFLIGIIQLVMGLMRVGFLLNFLSHSVLSGFTFTSALIIAASQLSKGFGFKTKQQSYVWQTLADFFHGCASGEVHRLSVAMFIINLFLLFGLTQIRTRLMASPAVKSRPALKALLRLLSVSLVVVTFNIVLVASLRLDLRGLRILGDVQAGMPPFAPGAVFDGEFTADASKLMPSALLISLVSFIESASVAKSMQQKYGITPGTLGADDNQELLGLGLANVATSIFSGFPVTGGFSRSTVNSEAGARTVMAGVFSGCILSLVLSCATSWFHYLPDVSLAALIVFSALRLIELRTVRYLWAVDKADATIWASTVLVTICGGVELGLMIGVCISVLRVVKVAALPHTAVLGRMPDGSTFRNLRRFPDLAKTVPRLAILRMDGPLFFANVEFLTHQVLRVAFPPAKGESDTALAWSAVVGVSNSNNVSSLSTSSDNEEGQLADPEEGHVVLVTRANEPIEAVLLDLSAVSSVDSAGIHALLEAIPMAIAEAASRRQKQRKTGEGKGDTAEPDEAAAPRLFLVGARGPVRDSLNRGEHAQHHKSNRGGSTSCLAVAHRVCGSTRTKKDNAETQQKENKEKEKELKEKREDEVSMPLLLQVDVKKGVELVSAMLERHRGEIRSGVMV